MKTLNNYYAEAEKIGGQSYLEGCLACASAYLVFFCMETRYEKVSVMTPHIFVVFLSFSTLLCLCVRC